MAKCLSIFNNVGLFSKTSIYKLRISVFRDIFDMVKNVLDRCDIVFLFLLLTQYFQFKSIEIVIFSENSIYSNHQ